MMAGQVQTFTGTPDKNLDLGIYSRNVKCENYISNIMLLFQKCCNFVINMIF